MYKKGLKSVKTLFFIKKLKIKIYEFYQHFKMYTSKYFNSKIVFVKRIEGFEKFVILIGSNSQN